nr:GntR family transcriptional regulator [uncultured Caproiciproducens sp.]
MKSKSLKEKAYNIIKSKIVSCEYPPNSFLNENFLQEEIGVSRTPIRDAIGRLEQESLVKIIPKKGIIVTELSINEINMIYETRMLIEPFAIEKYGNKVDKSILISIRELFTQEYTMDNIERLYEIDDRAHRIFITATQNKYIIQIYDNIQVQNNRIRILSGRKESRLSQSTQEHIKIIDAVLADNYEEAAGLIKTHLQVAKNAAFSLVLSNGGWIIHPQKDH